MFILKSKTDGFQPVRVVSLEKQNKLSHNCLFQELQLCFVCVSLVVYSSLVGPRCHMPDRTIGKRKCKETLTQVRDRLTREQANRTSRRISELIAGGYSSDSDSEDEQDINSGVGVDYLSLIRRDLYLGLLILLLLILLVPYWVSITFLRR